MNCFQVLTTLFVLLFSTVLHGQTVYDKNYDWSVNPEYIDTSKLVLTPDQKKADALYLSNIDICKLPDVSNLFVGFYFELKHIRILIQSKKGIEALNKYYLPIMGRDSYWGGEYNVTEVKARVIQPDGSCVIISQDSIFQGELEGRLYKYFAFDNLKVGSMIEVYMKTPSAYNGCPSEFLLTQKYPTLSRIIAYHNNSNLDPVVYQPKACEIKYEEQIDEVNKNRLLLFQYESLPASNQQELSNYANDNLFLYIQPANWDRLTKRVTMFFQVDLGFGKYWYKKREGKILKKSLNNSNKLINKWFVTNDTSAIVKLRRAEFFLKTKNEKFIADLDKSAKFIVNQGVVEKFHDMYTYSKLIGLAPQLIFASRGDYHSTPENFLCYYYFDFPLIYYPELNVYYSIDPNDRIGPAPSRFFNSNAIYYNIHGKKKLEAFRINEPKEDFSVDSLNVHLSFDGDELKAEISKTLKGNSALSYLQELNGASTIDRLKERESEVRYHFPKSDILSINVKNESLDSIYIEPLKISSSLECKDLIIDLDSIIILELGSVIGYQRELSGDENTKRESKMCLKNNTHFVRELVVSIPAGYKVKNITDFNIEFTGNETVGFQSKAKIIGDKLIVTVDEYYHKTNYSPTDYGIMYRVYSSSHRFFTTKLFLTR